MEQTLLAIALLCKIEDPSGNIGIQHYQRVCAAKILECLNLGIARYSDPLPRKTYDYHGTFLYSKCIADPSYRGEKQ